MDDDSSTADCVTGSHVKKSFMRVIILGGGGFLGRRLARELLEKGGLAQGKVRHLTLVDIAFSGEKFLSPVVDYIEGDFSDDITLKSILQQEPDLIFHLAAIVSGEAEKNFALGMKVNFHASLRLLELCREMELRPRIVFSSSCAVFGGDVTRVITEDTAPKPRTSYGTQKAMVDLLLNDYSRRGFVDGRSLRLPTISVRPGKPNAATSSFLSSIIREPLNGKQASYPVSPDSRFWLLSPKKVIRNFVHAANLNEKLLGDDRVINLPGLTVSIREMISSLERVTSPEVTRLISYEHDDFLQGIVLTWPPNFDTAKADALGFVKDASIEEIIWSYIDEEGIVNPQIRTRNESTG